MRKKALLLLSTVFLFSLVSFGKPAAFPTNASSYLNVYDNLRLANMGLSRQVFEYALRGWEKMAASKPILTIVDMSQPSTSKRMYIVDLLSGKLLFHTYVAHGRNSGELMAKNFSNIASSFQSSLGFYKTLGTYMGKHGLSLQLKGVERGFNDNAFDRAIVLHGADYVSEDFIRRTGRLGRSQGCPAVSNAESKSIIQAVKDGSCLFVYSPNDTYLKRSPLLCAVK